jgi:tetratricopeptide (TPR) repeat protein
MAVNLPLDKLLKGLPLSCLSFMLLTAPVRPLTPLAQATSPASIEAVQSEIRQLVEQGRRQQEQGQLEAALSTFQQVVTLAQRYRLRREEAIFLGKLGVIYFDLKQPQKSIDAFSQSLSVFQEIKLPQGEAATLIGLGGVYADLGQSQKALDAFNRALSIFRQIGDREGEAAVLTFIRQIQP